MLIKKPSDIKSSEITDQSNYMNRRRFLFEASASVASIAAGLSVPALLPSQQR